MFTLEIAGRAIAITDADVAHARELFGSEGFRDDLRSLESEGRPLWDGMAPFTIRAASDEEIAAFDDVLDEEENADTEDHAAGQVQDGDDEDEEDGINVLFLAPVDAADEAFGPPN
jgi:hypothetical protein